MTLENRLKEAGKGSPAGQSVVLKSELERELENEESELAQELRQGRAEEAVAKRKVRIKELKDLLRETGGRDMADTGTGARISRWTLIDGMPTRDANGEYDSFNDAYRVAQLEIQKQAGRQTDQKRWTVVDGKPLEDPEGEYSSFAQAYKIASLEVTKIIEKLRGELKGDTGKDQQVINSLQAELAKLREDVRQQLDPVWTFKRAAELTESFKAAGLIKETPATGESMESLKEKHRHEERLEELKETREHHEKITSIAGDAFENIGRGLASQVMEGGTEEASGEGSQLEYFLCPEEGCGTKIPVTPETKAVTCPKCHGIYQRTTKPPKE